MSTEDRYILPSSPSNRCLDRFSIVAEPDEDENGQVSFWSVSRQLLAAEITSPAGLIDLLETIAVTLRDSSGIAGDYGTLRKFLASRPDFWQTQWPKLADIALSMPELFPDHSLPILSASRATKCLQLNHRQVMCLIAHQFLCTLKVPSWKDDDMHYFAAWYGSEQRHEQAVLVYLEALFLYFEKYLDRYDDQDMSEDSWTTQYAIYDSSDLPKDMVFSVDNALQLSPLDAILVHEYSTDPDALGLPNGACVVSANRFVGFGRSATQEEVHVGCSPEACPVVLVTPPLQDDQILVVRGAEAMVNIRGQRRDISVIPQVPLTRDKWRKRTMLFMDALELDMVSGDDGLPDLQPGNVNREIRKAVIAFSSGHYNEVRTGLWGCGAFCGDPGIKMTALWCAASLAGVRLSIILEEPQHVLAGEYMAFIEQAQESCKTVGALKALLDSAPKVLMRDHTLEWLKDSVQQGA